MLFLFHLPIFINKMGINLFQAGMLDVVRRIPTLFNPLTGAIADMMNVRYFIVLGPAITAVCMCLTGVAPDYNSLLLLVLLAGIGSAIFHVPAPVMIRHFSHNSIGRGMSYYMLGGELARTFGPLTVIAALSLGGVQSLIYLIPFGLFATLMLFFQLRKTEDCRDHSKRKNGSFYATFRKHLPLFFLLGGVTLFRSALKASLTIYLPTYLTKSGSSLWLAGMSLAILQFAGAAGTLMSGTISDRIGRKKTLLAIAVLNPILMLFFIFYNGFLTVPLLILNGFFLFGSGPVMLAYVHDLKSDHMSFINGIYMTINFALSALMILYVGYL